MLRRHSICKQKTRSLILMNEVGKTTDTKTNMMYLWFWPLKSLTVNKHEAETSDFIEKLVKLSGQIALSE
mgnify:CR=1 FL=1